MAPRFEASGFAPSVKANFRLKALDDGKIRCYFDASCESFTNFSMTNPQHNLCARIYIISFLPTYLLNK